MTVTHQKRKYNIDKPELGGIKYHCDSCKRDITNTVRVKCGECTEVDFDLCVDCFRRGVEIGDHKKHHDYRLFDRYSYPVLDAQWGADEEWLLVEGIIQYGLGNWADIADHVGTKSLEQCRDHYLKFYIKSSRYPLPNFDIELNQKRVDAIHKQRMNSIAEQVRKQQMNVIPPMKPKVAPSQPANHEIQGYMAGRREFDVEPENDAEQIMKDMVFNDDDMAVEVELKLAILDIYNSRIEKRVDRKAFIFKHGLLQFKAHQAAEKKKSKEEKEISGKTKLFAPLMSPSDYQSLNEGLLIEQQLRERIAVLQKYRKMGIKTFQDADQYEFEKKHRSRSSSIGILPGAASLQSKGMSSGGLKSSSSRLSIRTSMEPPQQSGQMMDIDTPIQSTSGQFGSKSPNFASYPNDQKAGGGGGGKSSGKSLSKPQSSSSPFSVTKLDGYELLTLSEQELCEQLRISPKDYMVIKHNILRECERRGGLKLADAQDILRIDVNKIGRVFDFFKCKGWLYEPHGSSSIVNL
ncbi:hypothetical protein MP228_006473 [Amoeboaphelidium protococcarum]|nr:hypothetical protein MP228_006473 [Amoeboaphelidium protococcarum]